MMHSRPWLQYYSDADKAWQPRYSDMLRAFRAAVKQGGGGVRYFGARLSWDDIDVASDRLAVWAAGQGVARGDRVRAALVFVASGFLKLGKPFETEGLGEPDDGGARGVRPARKLLGRLEGSLLQVIDDVACDILL